MELIGAKNLPKYANSKSFFPINALTHVDKKTKKVNNNFANFDSPDRFLQSLKTQPDDWHYRTKEIEYIVNSSGYRTAEWNDIDWKESIVLFGCSNVMGIGLHEDETISSYLSQELSRPVINLGAPATGMDFSFYNSVILSENFPTPYAVVQIWTTVDRCTYFDKKNLVSCGPWEETRFFKEYVRNDYHSIINAKFISLASNSMWKDRCKYFSATFYDRTAHYTECDYVEIDNQARDLLHPGRENALTMAKLISKNIG
jgi:hypothetical protein